MDSLASRFTESKDRVSACAAVNAERRSRHALAGVTCGKNPFDLLPVLADAGSLDYARSSASGRSFSARDDRVEEEIDSLGFANDSATAGGSSLGNIAEFPKKDAKDGAPLVSGLPAECRDPSLGVLGFAKDSAASG